MRKQAQFAGHYVRHDGYYKTNAKYKRQTSKYWRRAIKKEITRWNYS